METNSEFIEDYAVETNLEFLEDVKQLAEAVQGFLRNDDGIDDGYIENMGIVWDVLQKAREIPALHDWADRLLACKSPNNPHAASLAITRAAPSFLESRQ